MGFLKKAVTFIADKEIKAKADELENLMIEEVHVKSGALRSAITTEKKGNAHYLIGIDVEKLKSDPRNIGRIDYSEPYYFGHKAYTIRAKKAQALRWVGKDGKVKFAKSVRIPASTGDKFIERAMLRRKKK